MSDWVPTHEAWDKFLSLLDADQEVAGEKYVDIQKRLIIYFECRRCLPAEEMADETIFRVIKRNDEGVIIEKLMGYIYGVARIVRLERVAAVRHEDSVKNELLRDFQGLVEPAADGEPDLVVKCFEECLEGLSPENRQFILSYYEELRRAKIDKRKSLAQKLDISQNAVTLRAYHIRKRLKKCIKASLKYRSG